MRDTCWKSVVAAAMLLGFAACDLAEAVASRARQPVVLGAELSLQRLGRELWLYTSTSVDGTSSEGANGLVVVGDDAVVVVDTPLGEGTTAALLDWIEDELRLPVRVVVLTSFCERRSDGLATLAERGIASIASEETRRLLAQRGGPLPTRSFTGHELLILDEETLELFHPGPGSRPDNSVVHLRRAKLLFGGPLLRPSETRTLGPLAGADLSSWPTALGFVRERFSGAEQVVPGSGAPGGQELLEHTLELLRAHGG